MSLIREKIEENLVFTGYVKTGEQLGDIFTKALNGARVEYFCNKLGMINIYAPALGGVLAVYICTYHNLVVSLGIIPS